MVYNEFQNVKLSALGMGAMRLPVVAGNDGEIDEEATKQMVSYAMKNGINYYDTAWGYHNGNSEIVMGEHTKGLSTGKLLFGDEVPGLRSVQYG